MNYPRCGVPADVAFVLSYDVECPIPGALQMADRHLQSNLKQFLDAWLFGVAAVMSSNLAKKLVIVGGYEVRQSVAQMSRPEVIKTLLQKHHDVDPMRIECVVSAPNTLGNAEAIALWLERERPMERECIVICAYWHVARASLDLMMQGIIVPVFPAEAVWLADSHSAQERRALKEALIERLGFGDLAERVAGECNGIADKLCGKYQPFSERSKQKTAA